MVWFQAEKRSLFQGPLNPVSKQGIRLGYSALAVPVSVGSLLPPWRHLDMVRALEWRVQLFGDLVSRKVFPKRSRLIPLLSILSSLGMLIKSINRVPFSSYRNFRGRS
jgi:hypothetical protein